MKRMLLPLGLGMVWLLVAGCQIALPGRGGAPDAPSGNPITGAAVTVESLDAPGTVATLTPESAAAVETGVTGAGTAEADAPDNPANRPPQTRPKPAPRGAAQSAAGAAAQDPVAAEPATVPPVTAAPKSATQLACEKAKGRYIPVGKSGLKACQKPTRDGGKQCRSQGDCQGECLARSGTCAPFTPLFGCNEVLQADGRRVTLCLQ